jgi:DNA-binding IclR family transcriptional regulator
MPTQSVDRALAILKQFSVDEPQLGVTELSRRVGLTKSTVHRLLASLRQGGLVEQDPESREYRLGLGLLELAHTVISSEALLRTAAPYLRYLTERVGEAAYLAVREGHEVTTLIQVLGPALGQQVTWCGRMPLHATSSGKVLLAQLEESELTALLEEGLPRYTESTITEPAILREELQRVREQGFGVCFEEAERGVNAIAVPIVKPDGTVVAALAVVGRAYTMTQEKALASLERLKATSVEITLDLQRLGYEGHPSQAGRAA